MSVKSKRIIVNIPEEVYAQLKNAADLHHMSMSLYVLQSVVLRLAKEIK